MPFGIIAILVIGYIAVFTESAYPILEWLVNLIKGIF